VVTGAMLGGFTPLREPLSASNRGGSPAPRSQEVVAMERASGGNEPKLSLFWVVTQLTEGRENFRKFWANCRLADQYYLGDFSFPVTENGTSVRLGTAQSVINSMVTHVTPQFVDITVPPSGPRGQARAERQEKFLRGANHMLEQRRPTRRITAQHMALYGVAWEKTEFAANRWTDFPEIPRDEDFSEEEYRAELQEVLKKRHIDFPIITGSWNPQTMIWDVNNSDDPRWVIHFYETDAYWVKAHFPDWKGPSSGKVEFIEVWTREQVGYLADRKWALDPRPHGYDILPWTMYWPQTGISTIGNKPEHIYRGILHGNFEMLQAESRLASHYLDIVQRSAWPTREFRGPAGLTEQYRARYDDKPGAKNFLPANVSVEVSQVPEPSPTILAAKDMLEGAIEQNTAPSVVRGQRPSGASSGYETAVLAGIAALNFGPAVEAAQRGLQRRNEIIQRIVEYIIRDKVTVWGRTEAGNIDASIGPKDIKGHYTNFVQLNSASPEEQDRKLSTWSQLWQLGFVDHDTALRKAGVTNALEVRGKILAEKFIASEPVQQILQMEAAKRVPLLSQLLEAQNEGTGSAAQADEIASNILNTQGATQLPNAGNFSTTSQPTRGDERARTFTNTRPVIPGSARESDLVARQISSPTRTGPRRVPTSDLPPGLGR
jgi:hypothetical protein